MKQQPNYISSEDVEKARSLGKFLKDKANWDLSTKEVIELFQHLMWYNTLVQKLQDNIIELKDFKSKEELEKESPKKPIKKKKK